MNILRARRDFYAAGLGFSAGERLALWFFLPILDDVGHANDEDFSVALVLLLLLSAPP